MKNLTTLFFALVILICVANSLLIAQISPVDARLWSRITLDPNQPTKVEMPQWVPAPQVPRFFDFGDGIMVDPNFRPHPTTNTTQSEMSVDVHPTNNNIVFGSANASTWPVTTIYGTGVYWSYDGGVVWGGSDIPPFGQNGGDPASVIGPDGYLYEAYLVGGSYSLGVAVSTNNGVNWTSHIAYSVSNQDKEHIMVDKLVSSPYSNRLYYTWSDLNGSEAALVYSTNFGSTWSAYKNISGTITPLGSAFAQGPNVQTGPNGEVYVAYAIYDANWTDGEDAIGFSKSTDGGNTWTAMRIQDHVNFGIRGTLSSKGGIRVNSFPAMAVDKSGGAYDGYIYVCWPQRGFAPAGNDPDVCMIKSSDGGATWSPVIRVNDDVLNNGKDQIFPWIAVDQATGRLMLVFYDSRNVANNQAEVFMATSLDGGNTFSEFPVSDQSFVFGPISGFAGGYGGDYIGVAGYDDVAYPYWMDSRTGVSQGWMAKVSFGPPCPVDPPTNPTPVNGATNVSINLSSINWTNGAGTTQIELQYGEAGSITTVYTGAPITSWALSGPLSYMTTYQWQVIDKNDTCSSPGSLWSFTTEQDPNFVQWCDDFTSLSNWTWIGPFGQTNWSASNTGTAGGTPPEMYMNWSPSFTGVSLMRSNVIPGFPNNVSVDYSFKFYLDWYANPSGIVTVGITYDGGATVNNLYTASDPTSSIGPIVISGSFTTPASGSQNLQIEVAYNGYSFNINWISFDDMCLSYIVPVELTSFNASVNNTDVTLNWNTATETNNQGFDVERMSAGGQFEKIGYVAGFGTTTEPKSYEFVDTKLGAGNYSYRLKQVDFDGTFEYSKEVNVEVTVPLEYSLEQNYPNPFNPSTTIKYSVAEDGFVKLSVYNMLGEEVANLVNTQQKAGRYEINFNAANLASGVYVYRLEAPNFTSSKKLMLMK